MNPVGPALHIHPGDCSADSLRRAEVGGRIMVWSEVLHEGPLRPVADENYRRERAVFLSAHTGGARTPGQCETKLRRQDEELAACREFPETVLWFDACLYDQTILVHLLDRLAGERARLSLLCVGEYPGFEAFHGLGELSPEQLAGLLPQRVPVTHAMLDLAQRAWQALVAGTPLAVARLAAGDTAALPYLGAALRRFLEQLPGREGGLDRLEREALEAIAAGATSPIAVFRAASAAEARPFFGDTFLWGCLNRLAEAPHPLVAIDGPEPRLPQWDSLGSERWCLSLTADGERVLAGEADAVALNGIDRWLGGTHLRPGNVWRWDGSRQELVPPV